MRIGSGPESGTMRPSLVAALAIAHVLCMFISEGVKDAELMQPKRHNMYNVHVHVHVPGSCL